MKRILQTAFIISASIVMQQSGADMTCGAINYQCDLQQKEMRVVFETKDCGSGLSPFVFSDSKLAGVYDDDQIRKKPILKKCPLGITPVTMVLTAHCVPEIRIYRDDLVAFDKNGNVDSASPPIAYVPQFGFMCGPGSDTSSMAFERMTVKLNQTHPTEHFSVELK